MTAAEMDIVIGAEVTGAVNGLKQVQTQLVKSEQTATKFTQKAGRDFTGLSRVIQDLPYGFNAISNNLTQLLPAAGAAGLAISAITTAITFVSIGFGAWTRGLNTNKEALDTHKKAMEGLYSEAGKEIAQLTTLTNAAKNTALSTGERLAAVKLLQKEFPSYFGNLSQEKILNGEVATAIQETTKALFARAVVRQKESELGPIAAQLFDLREQRKELERQEIALKRIQATASKTRTAGGVTARLFGAGSQDKNSLKDLTNQMAVLDGAILPLQGSFKKLSQAIIDASEEAGKGIFTEQVTEKAQKVKKVVEKIVDESKQIKPVADLFEGAVDFGRGIDIKPMNSFLIDVPAMTKNFEEGIARIGELYKVLQDVVTKGAIGIGEAIGNAFSGKQNLLSSLFDIIGNSLVALGTFVITGAELISNITKALTAALGGTAAAGLAVGIGLIALGTIMKNIPKFATGGVVTKPTLLLAGEQGPERITPLGYEGHARNAMAGQVEFQISGQALKGILRRTDNANYYTQ